MIVYIFFLIALISRVYGYCQGNQGGPSLAGGGIQGRPGGNLQELITTKCPTFDCSKAEEKLDSLECSLSKPVHGGFNFAGNSPGLRGLQKLLACMCCADIGSEYDEEEDAVLLTDNYYVNEEEGLNSSSEGPEAVGDVDASANFQYDETLIVGGNVTYNVFMNSCPQSTEEQQGDFHGASTLMQPQAQDIGFCQNHGKGKSAYNSIEVLGCTDRCLCFKQVAAQDEDANCDESKAKGWNIKMTCFDKCLMDCNGNNCGETAQPGDFPMRLMLTGSGPICSSPVSEEEFNCETTGMILDDEGNPVDAFNIE